MTQEKYELSPGQVLWLNDPEKIYQVSDGQVELYVVTAADALHYRQTFIDLLGPGRLLFAFSHMEADSIRLMVTTTSPATFHSINKIDLAGQGQPSAIDIRPEKIEAWLISLLSATDSPVAPRNFVSVSAGETLELSSDENLRTSEELVWISVLKGELGHGSLDGFILTDEIPLRKQSWLTAKAPSVVKARTTAEVFVPEACQAVLWKPLDQAHQLFNVLQANYFRQADQKDSERLSSRRQLRDKLLSGAAQQLLRTDFPDLNIAVSVDAVHSPLLQVVRSVALQLGIPEQQVRLPAGVDPSRCDLPALRNTIRLANMQIRPVTLEDGWENRDNGPLIAFLGQERRLIALLPETPVRYRLYDPEQSEGVEVNADILSIIHPLAYAVFAGLPAKRLDLSGLMSFIVKKCWPSDLWSIVVVSLVAGIIPMLTPLVTQTIFEDIIPINNRHGLVMVVQVMMVTAFATAGVNFARGITFMRVKNRSQLVLESALWLRLLSLPASFFRLYQAGDLTQRLSGVTQLSSLLSNSVVSAVFNMVFSFWSLLVMCYYSVKLTGVAMVFWLGYLLIASLLQWRMVTSKRQMVEATGKTAGQVLQIFNGLSKFRVQGAEAIAFYLWAKRFGEQWKWNREVRWRSNWLELIYTLQPVLLTMIIFGLTIHWMEAGKTDGQPFITMPEFMAFNAAMIGFNATLTSTISLSAGLLDVVPLFERLKPILETEPEITDDKIEAGELSGRIEVSNVSFRYRAELPLVLRNVSLDIRPGQFAAFVGSSGSGKSTLLRLLLGFEQSESGSIYFDGQDLAELNVVSVRSQLGVVLQNSQLMSGEILTNIIGSLPLTLDDAWQAAEMVGLADDIRAMPMGMNTVISEGASNISGGQRQRILIARSIVQRPRIILFDEATSALDNRTQSIVTESLHQMKATRIVVAHRLSTIVNADVIFVLDKGEIVERGSYQELMKKKGIFASLAVRQMA